MNNSVNAVESFRFLGTTISQDLKWDTHIDSIVKKAQQRNVLSSSTEKVQPATGAHDTVLLCCYWVGFVLFYNCMVWVSQQIRYKKTAADCLGQQKGSLVCTCQPSGFVLLQSEENGQVTSSQTPLTLDTTCLHFSLQADATDLCALEHLGIKTVFSPMPSPA